MLVSFAASTMTRIHAARVKAALAQHRPSLVSVDVFDTLLLSLVNHSVTRELECAHLVQTLGAASPWTAADLTTRRRIFDEQRARVSIAGSAEPGLSHWADTLHSLAPALAHQQLHALVQQAWQQTVLGTHTPNHELWSILLAYRAASGCVLCVTSDTMADTELLRDTLRRQRIEPDVVLASASEGTSKASGRLFQALRTLQTAKEHTILHIGDDFRADVWQAGRGGTTSVWVPRHAPLQRRFERAMPTSPDQHVRQLLDAAPGDVRTVESFAATVLCPLLVLLHAAVLHRVRESQADCAVFLARDAWLMFQCAQQLHDVAPLGVPAHYLRVSRRVVTAAHPVDLLAAAQGVAGRKGKETVGRLLAPFSLPVDLQERILRTAGLQLQTPMTDASRQQLVAAVGAHADAWAAERARQRDVLGRWARQELGAVTRPLFVDSGWVATSQDSLTAASPHWEHSAGVYLGLSNPHRTDLPVSRWGLLRDDSGTARHGRAVDRLASTLRIWEVVLREPAASVIGLHEAPDGTLTATLAATNESDHAERALAIRITSAVTAALQQHRDRWAAIITLAQKLTPQDLRVLAQEVTHAFVYRPGAALAREILATGYDEAAGHRRSLAELMQDPRDVWWPGVVATRLHGRSSD